MPRFEPQGRRFLNFLYIIIIIITIIIIVVIILHFEAILGCKMVNLTHRVYFEGDNVSHLFFDC